jgi:hypothetical protein
VKKVDLLFERIGNVHCIIRVKFNIKRAPNPLIAIGKRKVEVEGIKKAY